MAMKATYGVFGGKEVPIYKDPKTDEGGLKKSQRGCCKVLYNLTTGNYDCMDGFSTWVSNGQTSLEPVFQDGALLNTQTFQMIRGRLYDTRN